MGPTWGWEDPGGPHVGPMDFAIWVVLVGDIWDAWCVRIYMAWCKLCCVWLNPIHKKPNLDDRFAANCIWDCNNSDVIMGAMASQITNLAIVYSTVYSGADQRKHQSFRVTDLCVGNSPVTGEFPAQMASNAENVSIWWRNHIMPTHALHLWYVICYARLRARVSTWSCGNKHKHSYWGQNKMAATLQTMNFFVFWHRFHWSVSPRVQFTVHKSVLIQIMVWHRIGHKPLPEPIMTQFTGAYIDESPGLIAWLEAWMGICIDVNHVGLVLLGYSPYGCFNKKVNSVFCELRQQHFCTVLL